MPEKTTVKIEATEDWINKRIADAELVRDIVTAAEEHMLAMSKLAGATGYGAFKHGDPYAGRRAADRIYGVIEAFRVTAPSDE